MNVIQNYLNSNAYLERYKIVKLKTEIDKLFEEHKDADDVLQLMILKLKVNELFDDILKEENKKRHKFGTLFAEPINGWLTSIEPTVHTTVPRNNEYENMWVRTHNPTRNRTIYTAENIATTDPGIRLGDGVFGIDLDGDRDEVATTVSDTETRTFRNFIDNFLEDNR